MKLRKITSIVLCSSILFGLTGCDALKNMSAKNKKNLEFLYKRGRISADGIRQAYEDGLITEEEMNEILGADA